jgi:ribulose-phosphate 3-epimerase
MVRTARIAPSILSADFARLGEEVAAVTRAGADWIHVDVMDGHFVPNLTIGPVVVEAVRRSTSLPLDVHLMIADPDRYLDAFVEAGAAIVTVHAEACRHLHRTLTRIRQLGAKAGVSLNPATPVETIKDLAGEFDLLLIMSVNPGFGGQHFITHSLQKIRQARTLLASAGVAADVEVDGGVDTTNAAALVESGATVLVAGVSIFGTPDPAEATRRLRAAAGAR